ncbi:MAG: NTP transferase domain-containing protein [Acidilobaceae archaeon]|nr:NTP transferase domain-containing protein [Acidilobaceae archaeon]
MAGGKGSRMGGAEKPILELCGKPLLVRALEAARPFCREILVVTSPKAPLTRSLCPSLGVECLEGSGDYVSDLNMALAPPFPVLVLPSDLPFLEPEALREFLRAAEGMPYAVVNLLGPAGPSGVSLFKSWGGEWGDVRLEGYPLIDVDTWEDYWRAVEMCGRTAAGRQRG